MTRDEKNYCYISLENKILLVKQLYPGKYNDKIIYYTRESKNCPSRDICLTNKITGKIITDYTSDAKELIVHKFETLEGQHNIRNKYL